MKSNALSSVLGVSAVYSGEGRYDGAILTQLPDENADLDSLAQEYELETADNKTEESGAYNSSRVLGRKKGKKKKKKKNSKKGVKSISKSSKSSKSLKKSSKNDSSMKASEVKSISKSNKSSKSLKKSSENEISERTSGSCKSEGKHCNVYSDVGVLECCYGHCHADLRYCVSPIVDKLGVGTSCDQDRDCIGVHRYYDPYSGYEFYYERCNGSGVIERKYYEDCEFDTCWSSSWDDSFHEIKTYNKGDCRQSVCLSASRIEEDYNNDGTYKCYA